MAQTNLLLKVLLCLLVPAYQALQQAQGTNTHNPISLLRYWLILTAIFLSELALDQLNLSPCFTLVKLAIMLWFVAPVDYNGSHFLYEKVSELYPGHGALQGNLYRYSNRVSKSARPCWGTSSRTRWWRRWRGPCRTSSIISTTFSPVRPLVLVENWWRGHRDCSNITCH